MRNIIKEALVISAKIQGEDNRTICLLTKDGVEYSTLYGGPKSRLRGKASAWNSGTIYLYNDEVKKSSKITDFDVKNYHSTFRESLFKSWAASLACEYVIKTRCAGSPEEAYILLNGFLDGLDLCDEDQGRRGLIRFLWRYAGLLGIRPDTDECQGCGKAFFSGKNGIYDVSSIQGENDRAAYSFQENGFLCKECTTTKENNIPLSLKALFYLKASAAHDYSLSRHLSLDNVTLGELRNFVYWFTENSTGSKLHSLESGANIL